MGYRNIISPKIVLLIFLMIVLFCSSVGLISYYNSSKTLYNSICQAYENKAVDNSTLLSKVFEEKLIALRLIAKDEKIQTMDWETQKSELLKYIDILNVKRFRITKSSGLSYSTDGYVSDMSDREYFKKAMNGIPNISDLLRSKVDNSLIISCAVPVMDVNNHVLSVLSYTEDYHALNKMISDIKVGKKGNAILLNRKGIVVAYPRKDIILSGVSIFEQTKIDSSLQSVSNFAKIMIKGNTGTAFYNYKGEDKFVAYSPVAGTDWILGLTIPQKEIFGVIDSLRDKFILETILFIVVALLFCYLIMLYLSQKDRFKDLQKDSNEKNEQLKEMTEFDRLKTEFMANVSHELRTPLNVILSTLQLCRFYFKGDIPINLEKIKKYMDSMHQNGLRLLRLINNLIDITKIDGGFYELNLQYINIENLIDEIIHSVAEYAHDNGLSIQFYSEIKEKNIYCDPDKIERVMLNLISNAIKFSKPGGYILIKILDCMQNVVISVKDSGIGIPSDKLGTIFERFRQVEQSLTRNYQGSGIGLSLVKSLIDMHKGRITVASEIEKGSEFIIELPMDASNENTERIDFNINKHSISQEVVKLELSDILQSY